VATKKLGDSNGVEKERGHDGRLVLRERCGEPEIAGDWRQIVEEQRRRVELVVEKQRGRVGLVVAVVRRRAVRVQVQAEVELGDGGRRNLREGEADRGDALSDAEGGR
jgi:hypothetical protein